MQRGLFIAFGVVVVAAAIITVGWSAYVRPSAPFGGEPRPVDDALRAALRARGEDARSRGFHAEETLETRQVDLDAGRVSWSFDLDAGECISVSAAAAGCGSLEGLQLTLWPDGAEEVADVWPPRRDGEALGTRGATDAEGLQPQTVEACAWMDRAHVSVFSEVSRARHCAGEEASVVGVVRRAATDAVAGPGALRGYWLTEGVRTRHAAAAARAWLDAHALDGALEFGPVDVSATGGTPLAPATSEAACREAYRLADGAGVGGFVAPHVIGRGCPPESAHAHLAHGPPMNVTTGTRRVLAIVEPGAFGHEAAVVSLTRLDRGRRAEPPVAVLGAAERVTLEDTRSGEGFAFEHRVDPAEGLVYYTAATSDRATYRVEVRAAGGPGGASAPASEQPYVGAMHLPESVLEQEQRCAAEAGDEEEPGTAVGASDEGREACRALGIAYRTGDDEHPTDQGRADRAFERGCRIGDEESCAYHASALIERHTSPGRGPGDDLAEASCRRGGVASCALLGDRYRVALATEEGSAASATDAYRRACERGFEPACRNQALMGTLHIR